MQNVRRSGGGGYNRYVACHGHVHHLDAGGRALFGGEEVVKSCSGAGVEIQ